MSHFRIDVAIARHNAEVVRAIAGEILVKMNSLGQTSVTPAEQLNHIRTFVLSLIQAETAGLQDLPPAPSFQKEIVTAKEQLKLQMQFTKGTTQNHYTEKEVRAGWDEKLTAKQLAQKFGWKSRMPVYLWAKRLKRHYRGQRGRAA